MDTLKDYPGVEFKSKGRQVVAAGSIHPETLKAYEWHPEPPSLARLRPAPEALLKLIRRPDRTGEATAGGQYKQEQIAGMLESLDVTAFRDHDKWLRLIMACHHASNGDARSEFVEWSTSDPQFAQDAELIGQRWESLHTEKNDGITYKTLRKFIQDEGDPNTIPADDASDDFDAVEPPEEPSEDAWMEGGDTEPSTEVTRIKSRGLKVNNRSEAADSFENALCAVVQSGLEPAWDELKQNAIFRGDNLPWDETYGRVLDDNVLRLIRVCLINRFQGVAYSPSKENLFEALVTVAFDAKFNPVSDYLNSVKWDEVSASRASFQITSNAATARTRVPSPSASWSERRGGCLTPAASLTQCRSCEARRVGTNQRPSGCCSATVGTPTRTLATSATRTRR